MIRRALLVGINEYKHFRNLEGCINDLKSMRKILMNYLGFEAENMRVLVNDRATKDNIENRLNSLVEKSEEGDWLVFHFAGHGSQIRDRDEKDELKDHLDEIICPYDIDFDEHRFITDDDLYKIFERMKQGVHGEVFLDCCHSGPGTREISPRDSNNPVEQTRYRYLPPPFDIVCRSDAYPDLKKRGFGTKSRIAELNHVFWAACKEDQLAAEGVFEGKPHGAFTHYVSRHFGGTLGRVSRLGLLRRIRASLRHGEYSQIPQLVVPEGIEERAPYVQD